MSNNLRVIKLSLFLKASSGLVSDVKRFQYYHVGITGPVWFFKADWEHFY